MAQFAVQVTVWTKHCVEYACKYCLYWGLKSDKFTELDYIYATLYILGTERNESNILNRYKSGSCIFFVNADVSYNAGFSCIFVYMLFTYFVSYLLTFISCRNMLIWIFEE